MNVDKKHVLDGLDDSALSEMLLTLVNIIERLRSVDENTLHEARKRAKWLRDRAAVRSSKLEARPLEEWHEDFGPVLWCKFPIEEAPWVGTPLDSDWPDYHTHWTPLPPVPTEPGKGGGR